MKTEKNLVKEAEKRLMQENQSLLDQQRSQNVLLTNLQTFQVIQEKIILTLCTLSLNTFEYFLDFFPFVPYGCPLLKTFLE